MDKKKKLDLVARILRASDYHVKNKESNHHSRFDFVYDKESGDIDVFNAKKGDDTFFWNDFCMSVAVALQLSYYIHLDKYGTEKLCFHIY